MSRYSVHSKLLLVKTRIFLFLKLTLFLDFDSFANSADIILHLRDIIKGNYFVDFHETNIFLSVKYILYDISIFIFNLNTSSTKIEFKSNLQTTLSKEVKLRHANWEVNNHRGTVAKRKKQVFFFADLSFLFSNAGNFPKEAL